MRLRGHYKNYKKRGVGENTDDEIKAPEREDDSVDSKVTKGAKPVKPFKMIRQLMANPNFNMQLMVILLSLTSDNMQMDRRIDGMTTTVEKVRNITELVNNGVQSMKMVAEVPKSIRRLLE